ncbi:glycosyltransferase family 2 protein [Chitinimonas sp. JJ19]|uniref:glycosyltransferase family 2 protein n=1 Tax=Chitinimonas sp. JJ19 TaxID=3109352 RepID=UPI00300142E0
MSDLVKEIDVLVVCYQPAREGLDELLQSLDRERLRSGVSLRLLVWDNSISEDARERVNQWVAAAPAAFAAQVWRDGGNLGFGGGHNALLAHAKADWLLLLNQDLTLEPDALGQLQQRAGSAADVAVWEMRQLPYEHPKVYDPSSLDTPWFSGAAFLIRRTAMLQVGGFEPRIFMYGEDVDLAWRLQAKGWRTCYLPQAAVVHHTYRYAHEVKPLQALEGTLTNLCLRARFGNWSNVARGLAMLGTEIMMPSSFPGRRWGLIKLFFRFWLRFPYFWRSGREWRGKGQSQFLFWNYAMHRDGAFEVFKSRVGVDVAELPLVSVIVRTHARPDVLREALQSLANQTYPRLEVMVVEDGAPTAQAMVEAEFAGRMNVRYFATGEKVGRSEAGNRAMAAAQGEWMNFLDDDDQLFADHVEVLLETALTQGKRGAYGLAWEVATEIDSYSPFRYRELNHATVHRQPFSRLTMWHHNYLPIQAVLFHRSLFERHGGFATEMDQLEDWNLWTRYTLHDDFVMVEKTTSKYRVPANAEVQQARQGKLDEAYQYALAKQAEMKLTMTPQEILALVGDFNRSQTVVYITKSSLRHMCQTWPGLRWLYARRQVVLLGLRRMRAWLPGRA